VLFISRGRTGATVPSAGRDAGPTRCGRLLLARLRRGAGPAGPCRRRAEEARAQGQVGARGTDLTGPATPSHIIMRRRHPQIKGLVEAPEHEGLMYYSGYRYDLVDQEHEASLSSFQRCWRAQWNLKPRGPEWLPEIIRLTWL